MQRSWQTQPIKPKEWRRVAGFTLFVLLMTTAPYIFAWTRQTDDLAFSGALIGAEDANSYLSKMRLGARGEWAFRLFYTPEETEGAFGFFLPYIATGQVIGAVVTDDAQLPAALMIGFQAMRIVCVAIFMVALYRFIALFVTAQRTRYHALVIAVFGGGLAWVLFFLAPHIDAPDLYIPEGYSFLIVYSLPHLALARAAMLLGFAALITGTSTRSGIIAGLWWWIVGLCVPFYFAVIYVVLGAWGLAVWIGTRRFPRELAIRGVIAGVITLPLFAYSAYVFATNAAFAQWSAQNTLISPNVLAYVLGYLPLAGLAAFGIGAAWRRARISARYWLLMAWVVIVPVLVYLPINVQRRLAEGVIVPLAILGAMGARRLFVRGYSTQARRWMGRFAIGTICLTSAMIIATGFLAGLARNQPVYVPTSELRALAWLQANAEPDDLVLAAWSTGNRIPVYTDLRPFVGLGPETLFAQSKDEQVRRFYSEDLSLEALTSILVQPCLDRFRWSPGIITLSPNELSRLPLRLDNLRYTPTPSAECAVDYLYFGAAEREIAGGEMPSWAEGGNLVYDADGVMIYAVQQ